MAGGGAVVQEAIGTKVVREIYFRKHIAIEIGDADGEGPAAGDFFAKNIFDLGIIRRRLFAAATTLPEEEMFIATVEGLGFAFVHDFGAAGFSVEDMAAVLEIISD